MAPARAFFSLLALCWAFVAMAQVAVPPLTARITDLTGTLTAQQKTTLEQTLQAFEAKKGTQIAVLLLPTTEPETIEQYALRVAEQWKLGRKKVDDGALLIVAKDDRSMRIEVGYGLEGALNDATSKRIIAEIITPRFKEGDLYGGLVAGVDSMIRVADGEALPAPAKGADGSGLSDDVETYVPLFFVLVMVVGGVLRAIFGKFFGAAATGGLIGLIAWFVAGAVFMGILAGVLGFFITLIGGGAHRLGGGRRGGGFGGFGGGGGGGGGFSGGGGGFGGGGASGKW